MTAAGLERWIAVSVAIHALGISLWVAAGPGGKTRPSTPVPVQVLLVDAAPAPAPGGEKGASAKGRAGAPPQAAPRRPVRPKTEAKTSDPPKRSGRTTVQIHRQTTRTPRRATRIAPRTVEHRPRAEPLEEAGRPRPASVPEPKPKPPPPPPPASRGAPDPPAPPAEARPAGLPEPSLPSEPQWAAEAPPKEPAAAPEAELSPPAQTDEPPAGPEAASPAVEGPAPEPQDDPPASAGEAETAAPEIGAGALPAPAPSAGIRPARANAGDRDAQPDYAAISPPPYPRLARRRGWQGVVRLRVRVSPDGRVIEASVDQSSGYQVLDRAALEAVQGWRFTPAVRGGHPVESVVVVPVRFALDRSR